MMLQRDGATGKITDLNRLFYPSQILNPVLAKPKVDLDKSLCRARANFVSSKK